MKNFSKNNLFIYIIFFLATLILILTIGLKILLNSSIFIAHFFNEKKPEPLNKMTDFYGNLNIDNIPTATNSSKFIVSGSVVNYDKIQFFINDKKINEISTLSNNSFSEEIGELTEGENKVYLKAVSNDLKSSKKSDIFTVIYKPNKPKLEIIEPQDKTKLSNQEVLIKGSTDKEVFIKIDNLPITVDVNGNFQTTIKLKEGDNSILITAEDIAGNLETKDLSITYQKED